ncbi:HAD-IIIA family hydrolase [Candidatus Pelagibacter sp. HIMB1542]|uniref:HAD-IIIA family hydrolase n=1 Tax=Candidatus Pelagibacter sp. HIMB1542 TaxID=3413346 RepID=UPI003F866A46
MKIKKKFQKTDLVILAGGYGSRIKKYLKNKPKPLLKFQNKPFLDLILNHYSKFPFEKIFILAGYKGKEIFKRYNNKFKNFVKIKVIIEKKPLGTGGSVKSISNQLKNNTLIVNGDSFLDVNLNEVFFKKKNLMYLTSNDSYKSNNQLSNLKINNKGLVIFEKKGKLMNAGIYLISKNNLKIFSKNIFSLEKEIIEKLINKKEIFGLNIKNFFIDIGTKENLLKSFKIIPKYFTKPAVFLDRDGVINYDYHYVNKVKNFKLRPGVIEGIKKIIKKNYHIFILTNQAGVAKKIFKEKNFYNLQIHFKKFLSSQNLMIDEVQYCFFHPKAKILKYKKNSYFRKPGNGMVKKLLKNWFVYKKKSLFIGDSIVDQKCAKKSGIKFYFAEKNFDKQINKLI